MMSSLTDYYHSIMEKSDPRSSKLLLLDDPRWVLMLAVGYLLTVYYGKQFMKHREAFQLRNVLIGYNLFSVVLSIWMVYETFVCTIMNPDFSLLYENIDPNDTSPLTMRMMHSHWWYFFSKIIEFSDTFFFVLRKKDNQISFLHVYHHVSMLLLQWVLVKYVPGGPAYFGNLLNSFVHAVMYSYYLLAAIGPHMQKYLWWKRYLTKVQMYQFVAIFLYCSNSIATPETQPITKIMMWVHWVYMLSMFYLFNAFYQSSYNNRNSSNSKSGGADKINSSNGHAGQSIAEDKSNIKAD